MFEQADGHRGRHQRVPGRRGPDRLDEQRRPAVLQQEPGRPRAQRSVDVFVQVEGGDDDHSHRVGNPRPGQDPGSLQAVQLGHPDVQQAHVGPEPPCLLDRLGAVRGGRHDLHVLLGIQNHLKTGPHQLLVVRDEHPNRHPMDSASWGRDIDLSGDAPIYQPGSEPIRHDASTRGGLPHERCAGDQPRTRSRIVLNEASSRGPITSRLVTGLLRHSSRRSRIRPTGPTREMPSASSSGIALNASSLRPAR